MKGLYQFILEGGHAVTASPIPAEMSMPIYKEIEAKLLETAHTLQGHIAVLGSVGKKKKGDYNGDIDVAIEFNRHQFEEILKKTFPDAEYAKASMPNIVSINYPYDYKGRTSYAQVDFMIVDDLEWALFVYTSPDFTIDESHYKAAIRNHLLSIMISEVPTGEADQVNDKGEVETRWKHSLNFAFGVTKQFLDYRGRNGLLKNPKKVKEFEQVVTKNKKEFIELLFDRGKDEDFKSLETLWKALHTKYKYQDRVGTIEDRFYVEVLERNGLDRDEFLKYINQ